MPSVRVDAVNIHYEESGQGRPLVFVHEFAGDHRSWHLQMRFFSRRYRAIAFNARGYPPSDVPDDAKAYSQDRAAAGYGSVPGDREKFRRDTEVVARRFEEDGMVRTAEMYAKGPTRVQFMEKDPFGWREFHAQLAEGSARGHALTQRGVQMLRPSILDLGRELERLEVPTLIMTGDEDDPCLEPAIFMKRKIPTAGLVVLPKSGHTINLEEPEVFNRAVLDFLTAVDAGKWTRRNPASQTGSAILPAETR